MLSLLPTLVHTVSYSSLVYSLYGDFSITYLASQVLYCSHSCRDMHGLSVHGLPNIDMTSSYYLAGFWEIIQCSLQVIQDGFVSFRNSSSFCCISGFENFCRQYDTRIAGLCITRKFSEQAGQVKVEKCPQSIQFAYLNINFSSFQTGFLNSSKTLFILARER